MMTEQTIQILAWASIGLQGMLDLILCSFLRLPKFSIFWTAIVSNPAIRKLQGRAKLISFVTKLKHLPAHNHGLRRCGTLLWYFADKPVCIGWEHGSLHPSPGGLPAKLIAELNIHMHLCTQQCIQDDYSNLLTVSPPFKNVHYNKH